MDCTGSESLCNHTPKLHRAELVGLALLCHAIEKVSSKRMKIQTGRA